MNPGRLKLGTVFLGLMTFGLFLVILSVLLS